MNPFHTHGLTHLSASSINMWAQCPGRFFALKIDGYKPPGGASMQRGIAAEDGVVLALKGVPIDEAIAQAEAGYDKACRFGNILGDIPGERENIAPIIRQFVPALAKYGKPNFPEKGQHKISIPIRFGQEPDQVIDIIGYIDLDFDEHVIDLKSTMRIPSDMSFSHRIQHAIYSRTTNKPVSFLYGSPKKTLLLTDSDTAASQSAVRAIVQRMAAFLALSPDKEILRAAVPVIVDGWSWNREEDARQRLFGI